MAALNCVSSSAFLSNSTTTSGVTPFPCISCPLGVKYLAIVNLIALPSVSGFSVCTIPFPYVCVPTMIPFS